jgi:hypothetical protein
LSQGGAIEIAVKSFTNIAERLSVTKRPGFENVPLLQDEEDEYDAMNDAEEGGMSSA